MRYLDLMRNFPDILLDGNQRVLRMTEHLGCYLQYSSAGGTVLYSICKDKIRWDAKARANYR